MELDAPVHKHTRLLVIAPGHDADGNSSPVVGFRLVNIDDSIHQPYEALSYRWGEQDSAKYTRTHPGVGDRNEEPQGSNGIERWMPWRWNRSERSGTIPVWTRKDESLGSMQNWRDNHSDGGENRREEDLEADMATLVRDPFFDSKLDSLASVNCPFCQDVFSGMYRRGNLMRHVRQKHDAPRHVGRSRHRKLAYTMFLTCAQLACTIPLNSYDHCHGDPACRPPIASSTVLNGFPPFFDFLRQPTTNGFVLSALAYSAAAMYQYHINEGYRFQQLCLIVGVATGFLLSVSSPSGPKGQRATTSTMAMAITIALLVSVLGHQVYAMFSGKNNCKDMVADEEKKVGGNEV